MPSRLPQRLPEPDPSDDDVAAAWDVIRRRLLARPAPPPPALTGERLLTLQACADRLSISLRSMKRVVARLELPTQLVLGRRLVREADLDAYIGTGS